MDAPAERVRTWVRKSDEVSTPSSSEAHRYRLSQQPEVKRALELHDEGNGLLVREISEIIGRPETTIDRWIRYFGTPRDKKEAQEEVCKRKGYAERVKRTCRYVADNPHRTWPEIAEALNQCRQTCMAHWKSPHNPYARHIKTGEGEALYAPPIKKHMAQQFVKISGSSRAPDYLDVSEVSTNHENGITA